MRSRFVDRCSCLVTKGVIEIFTPGTGITIDTGAIVGRLMSCVVDGTGCLLAVTNEIKQKLALTRLYYLVQCVISWNVE
jgi:hypothetical protein